MYQEMKIVRLASAILQSGNEAKLLARCKLPHRFSNTNCKIEIVMLKLKSSNINVPTLTRFTVLIYPVLAIYSNNVLTYI